MSDRVPGSAQLPDPSRAAEVSVLRLSDCTVDLTRLRILPRSGPERELTTQEAALLSYLAGRAGQDVPRGELLTEVWGLPEHATTRAVDFAVARLRRKLGEGSPPRHLLTAHGVGYRFVPLTDPAPTSPGPQVAERPPVPLAVGAFDPIRCLVLSARGAPIPLTHLEARVLDELAAHIGQTVRRTRIIREVWGRGRHDRSLDGVVSRLRRKLEPDPTAPVVLITVHGVGFRLEGDPRSPARTNLAASETSFVEVPALEDLASLLQDHRLVTVCGVGGLGKTRLARELGLRLLTAGAAAQVWFCDLTTALAERGIVRGVEAALGLGPADGDPVDRIGAVLAGRPDGTLVILDNFEQVTAHAPTVRTWLEAAPRVRFLVTSREPLGLPEERCLQLQPLPVDAGIALLAARAAPETSLAADDAVVRGLVEALDGLPLAIELAAARLDQLSPSELGARLGQRLDLLVRPPVGLQSQHTTLRGALDGSWDLLTSEERTTLAALSAFAGVLVEELVADVVGTEDVEPRVRHLQTRSWIQSDAAGRRLLESVRQYAAEKLAILGLREPVHRRHRDAVLARAESLVPHLDGPDALGVLAELRCLRDDLLAIHTRTSEPATAARVVLALGELLWLDGPVALHRELVASVSTDEVGPVLGSRIAAARGDIERRYGDIERACAWFREARERIGELDGPLEARARRKLAVALRLAGDHDGAQAEAEAALAVSRAEGLPSGAALTRLCLLLLDLDRGRYDAVLTAAGPLRRQLQAAGDSRTEMSLLSHLIEVYSHTLDLDAEEACLQDMLSLAVQLGDGSHEIICHARGALLAVKRGDLVRADALLRSADRRCLELGELNRLRLIWIYRGTLALRQGDLDVAADFLQDAADAASGRLLEDAGASINLAVLRLLQGRPEAARTLLEPALEALVGSGLERARAYALGYLAAARAWAGDLPGAEADLQTARETAPSQVAILDGFLELCAGVVDCARHQAGEAVDLARWREAVARLADGRRYALDEDTAFALGLLEQALDP